MRLFILENNLRERLGHFLNCTLGLRYAAEASSRFDEVSVYCNRRASGEVLAHPDAIPLFRDLTWRRLRFTSAYTSVRQLGTRFAEDLRRIPEICRNDVLLLPTSQENQVLGVAEYLNAIPKAKRPFVVLNFHVDNMSSVPNRSNVATRAFESLFKAAGNRACVTAPTSSLAESLQRVCGSMLPQRFPLPQLYRDCKDHYVRGKVPEQPLISILGRPTRRKGASRVSSIVSAIHESHASARFLVQSSLMTPGMLGMLRAPFVAVRIGGLTPDEYHEALCSSQILLMPYHRDAYVTRASGVFADCAAYGNVAIVPDGTWMAEQIRHGRASGEIFDPCKPGDMNSAALRALANLENHLHAAAASRTYWRTYWRTSQSAEAFVGELLNVVHPNQETLYRDADRRAAVNDDFHSYPDRRLSA